MTLLARHFNEEKPELYHYEAWSNDEDPELIFFLAEGTKKDDLVSEWKRFTRAWTDSDFCKSMTKSQTIH